MVGRRVVLSGSGRSPYPAEQTGAEPRQVAVGARSVGADHDQPGVAAGVGDRGVQGFSSPGASR
ncbi:MAG TPA: hypothetical protein VFC00_06870 [Micromonosporaceae bacterium]|nr:hypothetical protein [Micromonosporaceae bacterium]